MKPISIVLVLLFGLLPTFGQSPSSVPKESFTPQQLQEDFALSRQLLETMHPALYDFVGKDKLDRWLDSTGRLLNRNMTALEYFKLLSPIVSGLGCGHTAIGLPTREGDYINRFFPFRLTFLKGKAYITASHDNVPDRLGSEVLSINGKPMATVIQELFRHISTDGINPSNRYMHLANRFDQYYALHIAQPDTFTLSVRTDNQHNTLISVPATTKRVARRANSSGPSPQPAFPFSLRLANPQVAVLTIDRFYIDLNDPQGTAYKQFLDSSFTLLKQKQIRNLVIDLRQSPGGYGTWGAWLYAYLTDKPFSYYTQAVVTTNQDLPFLQYTDWKQADYRAYVKDIIRTPSGAYRWTAHENLKRQLPQPNHFAGPVYVLMGRKSFSTTAEFCAIAHSNKRATFIGEETGGGYHSINGGDMMEMILPHTKTKLLIPMRKYVLAVKGYPHQGRGTMPDYPVVPTIQEFLRGTDVEMNFTLDLIKKRSK